MRKVYTLTDFVPDFFNALDDFLSNFSSAYSLIDSQDDRRVYHRTSDDIDLIFYKYTDIYVGDKIVLFISTGYDSDKEVWFQDGIIISSYDSKTSDIAIDSRSYNISCAYFYPAPTLSPGEKLVVNYNENVFMFSVIRSTTFSYICGDHEIHRTMNLVFGEATKYLKFTGGFFYGGDMVYTYEKYYRKSIIDGDEEYIGTNTYCNFCSEVFDLKFHIQKRPPRYIGYWPNPWVNDPYIQNPYGDVPDPDKSSRLDLFLRCDIDNAPNRGKDKLLTEKPAVEEMPLMRRNAIWAITPKTDFYVEMVASITNETEPLPRYEPLIGHDTVNEGHTVNTLNNISLIMPLWFMVMRDPIELQVYSAIAKSDIINFVSMFNMDTDSLKNGTFPTKENYEYNCFQMGSRRAMFGMRGYSGLAFKQGDEDAPDPSPPNLGLLDIPAMEAHKTGGQDILNIEVGGEKGYGGDTDFDDMPSGSFILKKPYTDYSSVVFTFCDDAGENTDTVTWTREQLDSALNGTEPFNLLPPDSPVTWAGSPGTWEVLPFSGGSTDNKFLCNFQNCGLIGAEGIE